MIASVAKGLSTFFTRLALSLSTALSFMAKLGLATVLSRASGV
jgi:hypothetical protein